MIESFWSRMRTTDAADTARSALSPQEFENQSKTVVA
jgi:hypothetical protein